MTVRELWNLYAAVETSYGSEATPGGSDVIEVFEVSVKPAHSVLEKAPNPQYLNEVGDIIEAKRWLELSFKTYLKGAGTSQAPVVGRFLQAAGFSESVDDVSGYAEYTPSNTSKSLTIIAQADNGYELKGVGCIVKNFSIVGAVGDYLIAQFDVVGLFSSESATVTSLTPSYENSSPLIVKGGTLGTGLADRYWKNLEIAVDNTQYEQPDASDTYGINAFIITGRRITGSFDPEVMNETILYPGDLISGFSISLGDISADNKVTITGANVKVADARDISGDNRVLRFSIPLIFLPSSGNDELSIKFEWTV